MLKVHQKELVRVWLSLQSHELFDRIALFTLKWSKVKTICNICITLNFLVSNLSVQQLGVLTSP